MFFKKPYNCFTVVYSCVHQSWLVCYCKPARLSTGEALLLSENNRARKEVGRLNTNKPRKERDPQYNQNHGSWTSAPLEFSTLAKLSWQLKSEAERFLNSTSLESQDISILQGTCVWFVRIRTSTRGHRRMYKLPTFNETSPSLTAIFWLWSYLLIHICYGLKWMGP